jgi:dTDP-glucose pyrophosphorylase
MDDTSQKGEGGIADAPELAEDVVEGPKFCVGLGDNTILGRFHRAAVVLLTYNGNMHFTMTGRTA